MYTFSSSLTPLLMGRGQSSWRVRSDGSPNGTKQKFKKKQNKTRDAQLPNPRESVDRRRPKNPLINASNGGLCWEDDASHKIFEK